jgi:hypothetical protein
MTTLLLLGLGIAQAGSLRIDGNEAERTFACEGRDVTVEGNELEITLTGDCGLVKAVGNDLELTVDGASKIEVVGNKNTVTWTRNLSGKKKLPVSKMGVGNKVKAK